MKLRQPVIAGLLPLRPVGWLFVPGTPTPLRAIAGTDDNSGKRGMPGYSRLELSRRSVIRDKNETVVFFLLGRWLQPLVVRTWKLLSGRRGCDVLNSTRPRRA